MNPPPLDTILADASFAPSVHNVQPVRWMIEGDRLALLRHFPTKLPFADPTEHDILVSAGAALEGAALAASRFGFRTLFQPQSASLIDATHERLGQLQFLAGGQVDPLAGQVSDRSSWRGPFAPANTNDRNAAQILNSDSSVVVPFGSELNEIAALADRASLHFMADKDFRHELMSWMRLSRRDPRWSLDGLNAEAMQMSRLEALGASILLGRPFALLNKIGLAGALTSEAARYQKAAGFVIVHRPEGESPIEQGRQFYRHWLEIERAGFVAQVVAALADDDQARTQIHDLAGLSQDRRILTAFIIGRLPNGAKRPARARLPIEEILVTQNASSVG